MKQGDIMNELKTLNDMKEVTKDGKKIHKESSFVNIEELKQSVIIRVKRWMKTKEKKS